MRIPESTMVTLLVSLGVNAEKWPLEKLNARVNQSGGVARYMEGQTIPSDLQSIYDEIVVDQTAGNLVEVYADMPETIPDETVGGTENSDTKPSANGTPVKTKKKSKAKKPAKAKKPTKKKPPSVPKEKVKRTYGDRMKAWKKKYGETGQPITERGLIVSLVFKELQRAGKFSPPRPITKRELHEILKAKFPERTPEKMWTYLTNLVPTRFENRRYVNIWRERMESGELGYWVVGDGTDAQPKPKKG